MKILGLFLLLTASGYSQDIFCLNGSCDVLKTIVAAPAKAVGQTISQSIATTKKVNCKLGKLIVSRPKVNTFVLSYRRFFKFRVDGLAR